MKYVNSLKYMNSFDAAPKESDISLKRIGELCSLLGRINIGTNSIFIPRGAAGHATGVMLESVIRSAGYKVGRLCPAYGFDSRKIVFLNGEIAQIEDYNRAVAELKSIIIKYPEETYFKEEVSYVLALLLCKMYACEYIIIEASTEHQENITALCAPYDMVIAPTFSDEDTVSVKTVCEAIKHGAREVISGIQKRSFYDMIASACVTCGARLDLTSKTSFKTEQCSSINVKFSYGERTGYSLKSPSLIQRECAMLVIESALAIRRDGIKMPWTSITSGLASAVGTGCFETVSVSPILILDSAGSDNEVKQLILTLDELFIGDNIDDLTLCLPSEAAYLSNKFSDRKIKRIVVVGESGEEFNDDGIERIACEDIKDAANHIIKLFRQGVNIICLGSVEFECAVSNEIAKLIKC